MRLALLLALATLLGCASTRPADPTLPSGVAPGPTQVRQASSRLHAALREQEGWAPAAAARSQTVEGLVLVELLPSEDRGAWGVDLDLLRLTLEKAVRDGHLLRLLRDERAVPDFLREEGEAETPAAHASLVIESWAGEDGRFHLVLREGQVKEAILAVSSDVAD
ncbi:MAG TPA: hypothetical protein DEA08_28610 [Planctomycetes bacterium]|nr:hypothetical protein [Planctomycetota bacterium]